MLNKNKLKHKKKTKIKTNLCCELARLGGGIGVTRFRATNDVFLLRGNGVILSCDKENVLCRVSSLTDAKLLLPKLNSNKIKIPKLKLQKKNTSVVDAKDMH